jgi:predicted metal-dependent peptidase
MQTRLCRADSRRMRSDLEAAIEYLPGLASLALWCNFADTDEDAIAFTDGQTIYAGIGYENFSEKERRFICLHEILHVALQHPNRFLALKKQDCGFNPQLLNLIADAVINKALENLTGLTTPTGAWTLERIWSALEKSEDENQPDNSNAQSVAPSYYSFGAASQSRKIGNLTKAEFTLAGRWSCEELYYFLKARAQKSDFLFSLLISEYEKDSLCGDLRGSNGMIGGELKNGQELFTGASVSNNKTNENDDWRQRLMLIRGIIPELFQRLVGEIPQSETPWEQILRSLVQTAFQEETVKNYSRPSRRWLALENEYPKRAGVCLPFSPDATKKRGSRLAVALDTSGSINKELLGRFLAEISALCELNQRNLVLIIGDAEVHQIAEIDWRDAGRELACLRYTGGGGTDFRPLIEAAAEFAPDALIYLTDLFGVSGDAPYFPVIWATHGVAGNAPWGEQIKLK